MARIRSQPKRQNYATRSFVSVTAGEVNNADVEKVHDTPGGTLGRASLLASRYAHMCMTVVALRDPRPPARHESPIPADSVTDPTMPAGRLPTMRIRAG